MEKKHIQFTDLSYPDARYINDFNALMPDTYLIGLDVFLHMVHTTFSHSLAQTFNVGAFPTGDWLARVTFNHSNTEVTVTCRDLSLTATTQTPLTLLALKEWVKLGVEVSDLDQKKYLDLRQIRERLPTLHHEEALLSEQLFALEAFKTLYPCTPLNKTVN